MINVDLTSYGNVNGLMLFKEDEKTIYIFGGQPGRFFRYDIDANKLMPLDLKAGARYWMKTSHVRAPDGRIYVGTYPNATVLVLDPQTDEVETLKQISSDLREEYVIDLAVDKKGILYFGLGMHHAELWSFNPKTGEKRQILPEKLQTYGHPPLWIGTNGAVYGRKGGTRFLCTPDKIEEGETAKRAKGVVTNNVGKKVATKINKKGDLELKDTATGKITFIQTDFTPPARRLFSISGLHYGKLYGSSFKPGVVYFFNIKNNEFKDLGYVTRGHVQVYDFLSYGEGILMSSYTGGYLDYYLPDVPLSDSNPRPVAALHRLVGQERGVQLTLGPDSNIYVPTYPIKGYLGGTLVRVRPRDWSVEIYKDLIHNQSFTSVVSVPETGELFVTSTIKGGSSSKPSEKNAWVFLWDPKTEQITYKTQPILGTNTYSKAVKAPNGTIYGFGGDRYYVFDPIKHKTIFKDKLPGRKKDNYPRPPVLSDAPASNGMIYGIDTEIGNLIMINTNNHKISILTQDDSMKDTRFAETEPDGYLYYENDGHLMRVKVIDD